MKKPEILATNLTPEEFTTDELKKIIQQKMDSRKQNSTD